MHTNSGSKWLSYGRNDPRTRGSGAMHLCRWGGGFGQDSVFKVLTPFSHPQKMADRQEPPKNAENRADPVVAGATHAKRGGARTRPLALHPRSTPHPPRATRAGIMSPPRAPPNRLVFAWEGRRARTHRRAQSAPRRRAAGAPKGPPPGHPGDPLDGRETRPGRPHARESGFLGATPPTLVANRKGLYFLAARVENNPD